MSLPRVLYTPAPSHTARVFQEATYHRLLSQFDVTANPDERNFTADELAALIPGFDALITGWGTPPMDAAFFERADRLRIIAHSAGSVKHFLSREAVDRYLIPRDIAVVSANYLIASNVAESTIGLLIMIPRLWFEHALRIRTSEIWRDPAIPGNGQYLLGATVGVVSASKVGREVIRMLAPFDARILCYDPYLSDEEAERLHVEKVSLNDLFARSDMVTLHAPNIAETYRMIGAEQLRLLRDGGVLINTARGAVLDHEALLQEAQTGRILVALDVTDPEPLPGDSLLRRLPNVLILPHISGYGHYGFHRIGRTTVEALENHFAGKSVTGAIRFEDYDRLA